MSSDVLIDLVPLVWFKDDLSHRPACRPRVVYGLVKVLPNGLVKLRVVNTGRIVRADPCRLESVTS